MYVRVWIDLSVAYGVGAYRCCVEVTIQFSFTVDDIAMFDYCILFMDSGDSLY